VLLHRLNNTHSLTYCSAQLTRTLNCKHHLQYIGFSVSYALCVTCSYSYSSLTPRYTAPQNKCSRELSFQGAKVPGNFRSRERMFPVGTFAPRSENTGERKVPEPTGVQYSKWGLTRLLYSVITVSFWFIHKVTCVPSADFCYTRAYTRLALCADNWQ